MRNEYMEKEKENKAKVHNLVPSIALLLEKRIMEPAVTPSKTEAMLAGEKEEGKARDRQEKEVE